MQLGLHRRGRGLLQQAGQDGVRLQHGPVEGLRYGRVGGPVQQAAREEGLPIFLRVLLYVYSNQSCDVRWNGQFSNKFPVTNGVRQGMQSSGLCFNLVVNDLIDKIRHQDIGLKICGRFLGIWVYCDDIIVASASRLGLQSMVTVCETFASTNNMKFSTNVNPVKSKTKCIIFTKNPANKEGVDKIVLNGDLLPWVEKVKHVGNILECDNSFTHDCQIKRGQFIGKIHSLNQEFYCATSNVKTTLYSIFTLSFYGSSLWNLFGPEVERIYKSYNVAIRIAFKVNRTTRTFLIEPMTETYHPHTLLCSRFVKFHETNLTCRKPSINMLAKLFENDLRTTYGNNLRKIAILCDTDVKDLSPLSVKTNVRYKQLPEDEEWRIPILTEMMFARDNNIEIEGLSRRDINDVINYICTI